MKRSVMDSFNDLILLLSLILGDVDELCNQSEADLSVSVVSYS